jgi:hypothetical protein
MSDDADNTAREIVCKWAGTDSSDQPLENLILAIAAALRARESEIVVAAQHALWEKDAAIKNSLAVKDEIIMEQQAEIAKLKAELEAARRKNAVGGEVKE